MEPCIWVEVDNNANGETLKVNAAEAEFWSGAKDSIMIQCSDVMAFDHGNGDPVTGVTIELTLTAASEWATQIRMLLGELTKVD